MVVVCELCVCVCVCLNTFVPAFTAFSDAFSFPTAVVRNIESRIILITRPTNTSAL